MSTSRCGRAAGAAAIRAVCGVAALALPLAACGSDEGAGGDSPQSATIGTHAVGGAYHAVGSGVGATVSEHSDIDLSVQPYAGPNAWMPEMQAGDLDFGLASTVDAGWAYTGGPGFQEPLTNVRLVLEGNRLINWGAIARSDSDIATLGDLEGRNVGTDFGGNVFSARLMEAELASVGLTWDDVNSVPQPEPFIGLQALQNGEIESTAGLSPDTPDVAELAQAVGGLESLPFGDYKPEDIEGDVPPEAQAILDEYVEGTTLTVAKAGTGSLEEDSVVFEYGLQMLASGDASPELVRETLATIWEHYEELHGVHPWAEEWNPDAMPTMSFNAPYHEGAVQFYEEQGVWTDEHQQRQDELLEGE